MVESWAELAKEMVKFHEEQIEAILEELAESYENDPWTELYIEVRDRKTGRYVRFSIRNYDEVVITIPVPQDTAELWRIADILGHPGSSWRYRDHYPDWTSGWAHQFTDADDRMQVTLPLVEAMHYGLGMRLEHLRIRLWSDEGPLYNHYRLQSDRPTECGAAARCTRWADFVDRLDWTLHTLPPETGLILSTDKSPMVVQFMHVRDGRLFADAVSQDLAGLDADQFNTRMIDLGWRPPDGSYPNWQAPAATAGAEPNLRGAARRAMATLRDVYGIDSPQDLRFSAFCETGHSLYYLPDELGLARATEQSEVNS
ncbi:hypothetical protein [Nocardia sp. NPDC127526]|uniref:TY-Chap domain-containing protein n=1 Tax=Nocardia sp. NPDC127526 TaxID=3345393 RepID=UPI00363E38CD